MTDYKELCAELVTELEGWCGTGTYDNTVNAHSVIDRARALLAQSVEEGPTDEELWELYDDKLGQFGFAEDWPWIRNYVRAVLAKWGHQ
jgi:hypothetical protein